MWTYTPLSITRTLMPIEELIADVISNSGHITLNTDTPTRVQHHTTTNKIICLFIGRIFFNKTNSSIKKYPPDITTVSKHYTTWHHGELNTHYIWPPTIITTINIRYDYRLHQNRRTFTNYIQESPLETIYRRHRVRFRSDHNTHQIHTANIILANIILMADKYNIPVGKMHSNCMHQPDHIVCNITQINNIRRANTCDPYLKLLNEEIISDIHKHKQNLWKEHLDVHYDHKHKTHILWKPIHGLSNRAPPPPSTLNTCITFNNTITTTPKISASLITFTNWLTKTNLCSDHLPILISFQMDVTINLIQHISSINLKRANWDRYSGEMEANRSKQRLPTKCQTRWKYFACHYF